MLDWLGKIRIFTAALIALAIMFAVMLFVNPWIDGHDGRSVLELQLSFQKERGIEIINGWGESGPDRFKKLIIFDYLYAAAYAFFFAATLSLLVLKHGLAGKSFYHRLVYLPLAAGGLDWLENSMEISFVSAPLSYSEGWFFFHSVVAAIKWAIVGGVAGTLLFLWIKKSPEPGMMRNKAK